MKLKLQLFIPAILFFILANILFFLPGEDLPSESFLDAIYFDKWVHAALFFILVVFTAHPFIKTKRYTKLLLIKISIIFILYGVAIEYMQEYFTSDRTFDYTDIIADAVGCIAGSFFAVWLVKKYSKKNKPL